MWPRGSSCSKVCAGDRWVDIGGQGEMGLMWYEGTGERERGRGGSQRLGFV